MTNKEFIQIDNYIINVSAISFIKKYRDKKGDYYISVYTKEFNIKVYYDNYTERDKDFKRILKELNI